MSEWISVKDRLPEKLGKYLVVVFDTDCHEPICVDIDTYHPELNIWEEYEISYRPEKVTHWMPFPQPPKKEEKN